MSSHSDGIDDYPLVTRGVVRAMRPCVPCGGSGRLKGDGAQYVCPSCNGRGRHRG